MSRLRYFTALSCLFSLFALTHTIHAQASAYGTIALTNYCLNDHTTLCKKDTAGLIGGMFYNFPTHSRVAVGIDGRGSYSFSASGGASGAVAARLSLIPHRVPLRPYFQLGGGVYSATLPTGLEPQPTRVTSGVLEFAGGLDIRLTDSFDLRAFELGAGASGSTPSAGGAFLDAGVVYHLHKHSKS